MAYPRGCAAPQSCRQGHLLTPPPDLCPQDERAAQGLETLDEEELAQQQAPPLPPLLPFLFTTHPTVLSLPRAPPHPPLPPAGRHRPQPARAPALLLPQRGGAEARPPLALRERCVSGLYGAGGDVCPVCTRRETEMCIRFARGGRGDVQPRDPAAPTAGDGARAGTCGVRAGGRPPPRRRRQLESGPV